MNPGESLPFQYPGPVLSSLTGTSLSSVPEACSVGLRSEERSRGQAQLGCHLYMEPGRFLSLVVWQNPLQTPATCLGPCTDSLRSPPWRAPSLHLLPASGQSPGCLGPRSGPSLSPPLSLALVSAGDGSQMLGVTSYPAKARERCFLGAGNGPPRETPAQPLLPSPSWSGLGPRLAQAVPAPPGLWAFDMGGEVSTVRKVRGGSGPGTEGVNGASGCSPVAGGEIGQTCMPGQSLAWGSGRGRGILAQHPERSRQASGALGSIPTRKVGNLPSGAHGGPHLGQGAGLGFSVSALCCQPGLLFLL